MCPSHDEHHLVRHRCPDDVVEQPVHGRLANRRVIDHNGVGHRDDQRVRKQHHAAFGQRFVATIFSASLRDGSCSRRSPPEHFRLVACSQCSALQEPVRDQAAAGSQLLPPADSADFPAAHQANLSNWAGRSTGESRQIHRMLMANPRQLVRASCHRPGRSLLTGSANLLNLRGVSKPQWSLCLVHAPWGSYLARGRLA